MESLPPMHSPPRTYRLFSAKAPLTLLGVSAVLITLMSSTLCARAQGTFRVLDTWKIGGEGGWDYLNVDPDAHLLYLTHGPRVEVIDTKTGKPVGAITGLKGTHGVVFDTDGKFGFVSDGRANAVVVFDRHTFQVVATIPAGGNPDGMTFEPVTKTVWAFNGRTSDVTVIDAAQWKVVATIKLAGRPEFPQADGRGMVFVNLESTNQIQRLDAKTLTSVGVWPLTGCDSPSGLAIDRDHRRLFSVCNGKKMIVTDADSGKVLASPTIGDGPDAASYDPAHQLAFSSNGEGNLTIVDASDPNYKVLQTVTTRRGARTMTFDTGSNRAYLVTAEYGPAPAATADNPRPRPSVVPGSFMVLVVGRD
ncbi:MAG TPA: YncE family protein [Acidisarcina sp.]